MDTGRFLSEDPLFGSVLSRDDMLPEDIRGVYERNGVRSQKVHDCRVPGEISNLRVWRPDPIPPPLSATSGVTDYTYDAPGNLWKVTGPANNDAGTRPVVTYGYDSVGRVTALLPDFLDT